MIGIAVACARAGSGRVKVTPPRRTTNSRRLTPDMGFFPPPNPSNSCYTLSRSVRHWPVLVIFSPNDSMPRGDRLEYIALPNFERANVGCGVIFSRNRATRSSSFLASCSLKSRHSVLCSFGETEANARAKRRSGPAPDTARRAQDAPAPTTAPVGAMPRRERRPNGTNRC
jgi:hypothetical protein